MQELQDPAVTDIACAALTGLKMGDKILTVRRATARFVLFPHPPPPLFFFHSEPQMYMN